MSRVTIVVPCFNEALRLPVRRFQEYANRDANVDFLFVNDGSRDSTLSLLEQLHERMPDRFSFLHLAKNCGKAEAVRQGFRFAFAAKPEYIGFWDADLATPLEEIPTFYRVLDERPHIDMVLASRVPLRGRDIERKPVRRLLGRVFAITASAALNIPLYDTQCGAKLFRLTPQFQAAVSEPFISRWIFDVEILARMARDRKLRDGAALADAIWEQPLLAWTEVPGSRLRPRDFVQAAFEMFHIYLRYVRSGPERKTLAVPTAAIASERKAA